MDQRLNLGNEVRELKLGSTFNTPKPRTSFHTLKYDFKPASVDLSKPATLDVSSNNQVTVTMPHLESSGVPKTVFKGNQRNYTKECVLIIDKVTGEITLEKLHHNIQVKKTRSETNTKSSSNFSSHQHPASSVNSASGASGGNASTSTNSSVLDRPAYLQNNTQRVSNKTRVSTGIRKNTIGSFVPRHSPIQGSPSYPHHRSPQQAPAWNANNGQSTLPSIPLIGLDDDYMPTTTPTKPVTNIVNNSVTPAAPSNLEVPHQYSYHSNKPSTSSPKLKAPSNNPMQSQSRHSGKTNHSPQNSSSLQSNANDKMQQLQPLSSHHQLPKDDSNEIGVLSTSDSSDSSDSDSNSSDSDSNSNSDDDDDDDDDNNVQMHGAMHKPNPINNGTGSSLPALLLDEDLRLSSNSSDSDDN